MTPRIYQLCREAVTFMAVQDAPLSKRIAKAYFLFLIHVSVDDLPDTLTHHLIAIKRAFEDEENETVGVTELTDAQSETLSRRVVDLFTGVADQFHDTGN